MPIIKSAKKRTRIANKATIRNRKTKRSLKSAIKAFQASLLGDKKQSSDLMAKAQGELDTAVKKGVLHKNKANRKKAKLASEAKKAGVKQKTSDKKATTTKTVAKKAPAKSAAKPAAKTPAKKPAAKKAPAK